MMAMLSVSIHFLGSFQDMDVEIILQVWKHTKDQSMNMRLMEYMSNRVCSQLSKKEKSGL